MSTYDIKRDKYLAETNFLNKLAPFLKKNLNVHFRKYLCMAISNELNLEEEAGCITRLI